MCQSKKKTLKLSDKSGGKKKMRKLIEEKSEKYNYNKYAFLLLEKKINKINKNQQNDKQK